MYRSALSASVFVNPFFGKRVNRLGDLLGGQLVDLRRS
jgi:hypothetical protein